MNKVIKSKYTFFSEESLSDSQIDTMIELINGKSVKLNYGILSGRGNIYEGKIDRYGSVVIKQYQRGGIFGKIIKDSYLKSSLTRPQMEYEGLLLAEKAGVSVPKPIAGIVQSKLFYKGWLITKKIELKSNFAELSLQNESKARSLLPELMRQINLLIDHSIYHADLHPGNILVSSQDKIYFIDFDKADVFIGSTLKLRNTYLLRWRRAVIKHNLPEFLSEYVAAELRNNLNAE